MLSEDLQPIFLLGSLSGVAAPPGSRTAKQVLLAAVDPPTSCEVRVLVQLPEQRGSVLCSGEDKDTQRLSHSSHSDFQIMQQSTMKSYLSLFIAPFYARFICPHVPALDFRMSNKSFRYEIKN